MSAPRTFRCSFHHQGTECRIETRLVVTAPDAEFGACPGHGAQVLAAAETLWPEAKLQRWGVITVERWGMTEVTIEDAALSDSEPFSQPEIKMPPSKHERTGCFHPFPCGCPDRSKS